MAINPFTGGTDSPNEAPRQIRYPYNWVQATSAGHMFEMNNTEDGNTYVCSMQMVIFLI